MIRMYPTFELSVGRGRILLAGSHFRADDFELMASHGPRTRLHTYLDEQYAYVDLPAEEDANDWVTRRYDYRRNELSEEMPSELEVAFAEDFLAGSWRKKYCFVKGSHQLHKPRETVLVDRDGNAFFTHGKSLGNIEFDSPDFVCLAKGHQRTCIDKKRRKIAWQQKLRYFRPISVFGERLVFLRSDLSSMKSQLHWLDLATGETVRSLDLAYGLTLMTLGALDAPEPDKAEARDPVLVFSAARSTGHLKTEAFTLYLDLESATYEVLPRRDRTAFQPDLGLGYYYAHTDSADLINRVVEDPSLYDETSIRRFQTRTGESAGEIPLPNAKLLYGLSLFKTPTGQGTLVIARDEEARFNYLALWDEEDFVNPEPEVHQEALLFDVERIAAESGTSYRVKIEAPVENFFQLFRQLSAGLAIVGTRESLHISTAGKAFDPDFAGEILCDVSHNDLTDPQLRAVTHLCEHLEAKLDFGSLRSPKNPDEPIRFLPVLD